MHTDDCVICRKHRGLEAVPPGGYIFEDVHWMVCHAPAEKGPLGTLFIESTRHVLDFSEFNDQESTSFAALVGRVYRALRSLVAAQRIYQVSMMEGVPHFHAWIVPRTSDVPERGVAFLSRDLTCFPEDAAQLAEKLRAALK